MSELNFIQAFIRVTERTESPPMFNLWSALAGVSCVLGRKVWIDMGRFTIYPNLYVVFVAESGRCRKSTAINFVESILRTLEPRPNLIAQKITAEGLIDALKCEANNGTTVLRSRHEGFVIADELATFLNQQAYDSGLGSLLTPLYDCKDSFEYRTKGRGSETLTNLCMGLLGAATVDWLRKAVPVEAIGGGVTSRINFIYESTEVEPVPDPRLTKEEREIVESLTRKLQRISTMQGEVTFTPEAWKLYERSYIHFRKTSPLCEIPTLSGYASRREMHVMKIAMLLALSEEKDLKIELRHYEGAIAIIEKAEEKLPEVMRVLQAVDKGENVVMVLRVLEKRQSVTRTELMRLVAHKLDAKLLSETIETLVQSRQIEVRYDGKSISYHKL